MSASDSLTAIEVTQKQKQYAEKAFALNPDEPEAIRAMMQMHYLNFEFNKLEEQAKRGLAIAPNNYDILLFASLVPEMKGRFDEFIRSVKRAVEVDPLNYLSHAVLASGYMHAGHLDSAETAMRTGFELGPDVPGMQWNMSEMYFFKEDYSTSLKYLEGIDFDKNAWARIWSFMPLYASGRAEEAEKVLKWAVAEQGEYHPYLIAQCYAYKKDIDKAFRWFEKTWELRDAYISFIKIDYLLDESVRSDPRYKALLKKMKLDNYY